MMLKYVSRNRFLYPNNENRLTWGTFPCVPVIYGCVVYRYKCFVKGN